MRFPIEPRTGREDSHAQPPALSVQMDGLEPRLLYYVLSGTQWASPDLSFSLMPDGTVIDQDHTSALFAHLDAQHSTEDWQRELARALQTWAAYSPLNFHLISDDGSPQGTTGSVQGDPRFGDIRFGAAGYEVLAFAWYPSTTTRGGDITLSTSYPFEIGAPFDLYSLFLHESGHSLGLRHSEDITAAMSTTSMRVLTGLSPDDIAGIQAIYGARLDDAFDTIARNDSFASATALTPDASGHIARTADLTSLADIDHYSVTVPAGSDGTLTVSVDARGLSLLAPAVFVYDAAGNFIASASAGDAYGTVATVSLSGLVAGQQYFIVADGGSGDVFGMGAYRLNAQFGMPVAPPDQSGAGGGGTDDGTGGGSEEPAVEPDRFESNDVATSAANLGRTTGFTLAGLSVHSVADRDYYRFVPSKNGTYVVSAVAGEGMGVQLTVLDGGQRVLASGTGATLSLTAGQVYYISVADCGGACGGYDLSLSKSTGGGGGGGGRKGNLEAPHLAGGGLHVDDSMEGARHEHAEQGLSQAWAMFAGPVRSSATRSLMDELDGSVEADLMAA